MARPKKQTVDYYPHMATSGKTIFILESRWGNDGYAFFYKLLETLCSTEGHCIDFNAPDEKEYLLAKTKVSEQTVIDILNKLAELNKIDRELWMEQKIWYQNLIDNIKDAYKKRIDQLPQKPLLTISVTGNYFKTEFPVEETLIQTVSGDGSTESKVKESKVYNIPPITPQNIPEEIKTEKIDYQGVLDEYNSLCIKMPQAEKLTDDRRSSIRVRIKDYGREAMSLVFRYASQSPHHNGQNDKGWIADFDWLIGPKNFRKMLERARSGTQPIGSTQKSRTDGAVEGSKRFLERMRGNDTGNDGKDISSSRTELPANIQP